MKGSLWLVTHRETIDIELLLQDLADPISFPQEPCEQQGQGLHERAQQPRSLQELVVSKQLGSLDRALSVLRSHQ